MKRVVERIAVVALLAFVLSRTATAGDTTTPDPMRQDLIANMMDAGRKVIELADATPENKYSWRPGKGVRSTSEVFMHLVGANYMLPGMLGADTGKSMDEAMKLEKSAPGKAEVKKMLAESYEVASKAIAGVPDSELDTKVDFFGNKITKRALILVLVSHSHEHLGQSIAYARMNGIVPPWTARQNAAAKKAADGK